MPLKWLLSIHDKRDVIEYPISDDLDISGWDIKKALQLFAKSNPALLEWIRSPIFYSKDLPFQNNFSKTDEKSFDPKSTIYHYLHMASKNYREFLQVENVKLKKYFYVLRPILACKWLEEKGTLPPVEFDRLILELSVEPSVLNEIEKLLIKKKSGTELDVGLKIKVLNQFLEEQIDYYQQYVKGIEKGLGIDIESLNTLFRNMLFEVYLKKSTSEFVLFFITLFRAVSLPPQDSAGAKKLGGSPAARKRPIVWAN